MIECFFSILTRQALTQSVQRSKKDLKDFLLRYLKKYSENPTPFVWTKAPEHFQRIILSKQPRSTKPIIPRSLSCGRSDFFCYREAVVLDGARWRAKRGADRVSAIPVSHRVRPSSESSQVRRAFHIATASTTALVLTFYRGHFYRINRGHFYRGLTGTKYA